jgi:glycerol-3-phosphate O-acyltransferase
MVEPAEGMESRKEEQAAPGESGERAPTETAERPMPDPSAMAARFGAIGRVLARAAFHRVRIDQTAIERVRRLATQGTIVYVLHQRSVIDYLMVNAVLLREGLPLPQYASGVSAVWFRPLRDILRLLRQRLRGAGLYSRQIRDVRDQDRCVRVLHQGGPVLIFMRSPRLRGWRKRTAELAGDGTEYLRGIVHSLWGRSDQVYLVPIAIFRGAGVPKREARRLALFYIVREVPGEAKRLLAYLLNRRHVTMTVGSELSVQRFVEQQQYAGEEQLVNRLTRALHGFLYNEERVVWGVPLRARAVVRDAVLSGADMGALVRQLARERGIPETAVWKEAEAAFEEMAANFDGLYFGLLAYLFRRLWPRIFSGLEIIGLEDVVACLRQHPIVLVPCHRSHFDYLILSWIFHERFLSPPHIAAGINLAFWPLGSLFRGAGAFFIRRSFEGNPLYKMVFRNYLAFLIREGYTQEFFIEGGRTRTGKILTPKLGMLSAILNAFVQGSRDDLYLVPVSIHYGRIVEEEAYKRELTGEEKPRESLRSLLRARSILRQRYGTVYVSFAEPISLQQVLGSQKERFRVHAAEPEVQRETRYFIQKLGFRLLREVNAAAVGGATSLSATALLAAPHPAIRVADFRRAASELAGLLQFQGVRLTAALERNLKSDFQEGIAWLGSGGLVQRLSEAGDDVLYVPADKRLNLDFYKNNLIHAFLLPSLVARALCRGVETAALRDEIWWWLELYRWEFALPEREALAVDLAKLLGFFQESGALRDGHPDEGHPLLVTARGILENFREAYRVTARTVTSEKDWPISEKVLLSHVRRAFSVAQLLGEVSKPEANSTVMYANALSRFTELGYISREAGGRTSKDRRIEPGSAYDRLLTLAERLAP